MNQEMLQDRLNELASQFAGNNSKTKQRKILSLADKADDKKLRKNISDLQELLDYLRICIKYQKFDLEATRRENEYLRKLLEGKGS